MAKTSLHTHTAVAHLPVVSEAFLFPGKLLRNRHFPLWSIGLSNPTTAELLRCVMDTPSHDSQKSLTWTEKLRVISLI